MERLNETETNEFYKMRYLIEKGRAEKQANDFNMMYKELYERERRLSNQYYIWYVIFFSSTVIRLLIDVITWIKS